uniref:Cytochrome c oxidase subunit 2 n=1 Tax=Orussus occidentalis TaxID=576952 RepID=C4NCE5_ORUOC|nr:cytochrome c oxidase subunit II [Orussus occidentalis]ACJ69696.1 cytochrome c oxidase subunit II [Orussus occidentalis]
MCTWMSMNMLDPSTPSMEFLNIFHDNISIIVIIILSLIIYIIFSLTSNKLKNRFLLQNQNIEIVWTILPMLTLSLMAIPSLMILYMMDEMWDPQFSIKIIGNQWYWKYEYNDISNKSIEIESFMEPESSSIKNSFRLIDVDSRLILPYKSFLRILVTSNDVIHSWTIPSFGLKVDATPGRINEASLMILRPGLYFGQCSEICGANHSFMPIVVEAVKYCKFIKWINFMLKS